MNLAETFTLATLFLDNGATFRCGARLIRLRPQDLSPPTFTSEMCQACIHAHQSTGYRKASSGI